MVYKPPPAAERFGLKTGPGRGGGNKGSLTETAPADSGGQTYL